MKLARLLWLYCVLASLALTLWIILIASSGGQLRQATATASQRLKQTTAAAQQQHDAVDALLEQQRSSRAKLSASDSIRLSAQVQVQQQKEAELDRERSSAESAYAAAEHTYASHMQRLIPIIALLILHLVGMMLFWPRPTEKGQKK